MAAALLSANPVAEPEAVAEVEAEWLAFEATAYTARCRGCSGITKTGLDVRHTQTDDSGKRIVAVDPAEIPLGSKLEIRIGNGDSCEVITGVAADIGGAIKGRKIDVLMATYDEAIEFGRQAVQIRIVSEE
ncbi:3D domain-containing protein [Paenibacillus sp. NPDC057967]|uniref:3D domain-containing protein n=1 Tax=Paenibacillus sp. NPDC057967 TaxID=3346293 RepID=UPI0036DA9979